MRLQKKLLWPIGLTALGLLGGFLYWRFIGCNSGSCPITSNWQLSTLMGGVVGYLAGDSVSDFRNGKRSKETSEA